MKHVVSGDIIVIPSFLSSCVDNRWVVDAFVVLNALEEIGVVDMHVNIFFVHLQVGF